MKKKYIFLVGAAKSGTTKLANMLGEHRDICLSAPKESDFFTNRVFNDKNEDWYDSLFKCSESNIRLDASTSYTQGWGKGCDTIANRIFSYAPEADIVYLVREPAERAWSSYWHSVRMGVEKRKVAEALADSSSQFIQGSLYYKRMLEYLEYYPEHKIHIISFKEFVKNPEGIANNLLKTLGYSAIEFSKEDIQKEVNKSYQWSGGMFSLLKYIPLRYIKRANELVKIVLPRVLHEWVKNIVSKPIPSITDDIRNLVNEMLAEDYLKFQQHFKKNMIHLDEE